MATSDGYRIRDNQLGKTAVCNDCCESTGIQNKLTSKSNVEKIDTRQYASELCVICQKDITKGNGGKINYPEEIALLFKELFSDEGSRFGGVHPMINSESSETEISKGVTKSEPIRTNHDPVVFSLQKHEKDIAIRVKNFINAIEKRGPIRGRKTTITDERGQTVGYEFKIFAIQ